MLLTSFFPARALSSKILITFSHFGVISNRHMALNFKLQPAKTQTIFSERETKRSRTHTERKKKHTTRGRFWLDALLGSESIFWARLIRFRWNWSWRTQVACKNSTFEPSKNANYFGGYGTNLIKKGFQKYRPSKSKHSYLPLKH